MLDIGSDVWFTVSQDPLKAKSAVTGKVVGHPYKDSLYKVRAGDMTFLCGTDEIAPFELGPDGALEFIHSLARAKQVAKRLKGN